MKMHCQVVVEGYPNLCLLYSRIAAKLNDHRAELGLKDSLLIRIWNRSVNNYNWHADGYLKEQSLKPIMVNVFHSIAVQL